MLITCLVCCPNKHITCYKVKNKTALLKMAKAKKIICPRCGKKIEELKPASWSPEQYFYCDKGHVTSIYPFEGGKFNLSWSDKEFINIDHDTQTIKKAILNGDIRCPITNNKSEICNLKLSTLSDDPLVPAKPQMAKTKTRLGDVWDKYHCPEPKHGEYDKNYEYHDSEFARRQKTRLKDLKKTRLTKQAGEVISRPTKRNYREQNHRKPRKNEI